MTIAMMGTGGEFTVERVRLCRETGKRLADMGFTEGAQGWVVRRGFLGGPMQIRLGECDIMIRASEAEGVDVTPTEGINHCRGRGHGQGRGRGADDREGREGRRGFGRRHG